MEDWADIEPRRWRELRRALQLLVWSAGLALTQCLSIASLPLLIIGARSLVQWAPNRAVRRGAQLLIISGAVQVMLIITFIAAVLVDDDNRFPTIFVAPIVTVIVLTSLLLIVGWIRAFRNLCLWGAANHIVAAWDKTIRRLPLAWLVIAVGAVGAAATDARAFAVVAAAAGVWSFWMIGHPTWWTYRLFCADLRPAHRAAIAVPPPPPPPSPSYRE